MTKTVQLDIPPTVGRGWPGTHSVGFGFSGGYQKWDTVTFTGTGWPYHLHITPTQLVGIAVKLVVLRVKRWFKLKTI